MDLPPEPTPPKTFISLFFGQKPPTPPPKQSTTPLEPGLKTLTRHVEPPPNHPITLFKSNILASPSPSSTRKFDSAMENEKHAEEREGKDLEREVEEREEEEKEEEEEQEGEEEEYDCGVCPLDWRLREGREFPPPIPSLARTGNLPCHMPWVLKRSYQNDGRLVIQEFKVRHHEFFRARRANGRLTLRLVQLDEPKPQPGPNLNGAIKQEKRSEPDDNESQREPKSDHLESHALAPSSSSSSLPSPPSVLLDDTNDHDHHDNHVSSSSSPSSSSSSSSASTVLSSSLPESSLGVIGGMAGGNAGGCFAPRKSNSLFQMPIPTIRPVHS